MEKPAAAHRARRQGGPFGKATESRVVPLTRPRIRPLLERHALNETLGMSARTIQRVLVVPNERIAGELNITPNTVRKWRGRFAAAGLPGLVDRPHPGCKPVIDPTQELTRPRSEAVDRGGQPRAVRLHVPPDVAVTL